MVQQADSFDLGRLGLASGEGRRLDLQVAFDPFDFGGERYTVAPVPARLDVSRTTGNGYALRLRFRAELAGPCMRCLQYASLAGDVDAREIDQPGGGDELSSPYVHDEELDLRAWARDALALELPNQLLCRDDCAGLCPLCGADLNADPSHEHEAEPDPRWAKLNELKLE
jgi:DUF177 domain-containing protein